MNETRIYVTMYACVWVLDKRVSVFTTIYLLCAFMYEARTSEILFDKIWAMRSCIINNRELFFKAGI